MVTILILVAVAAAFCQGEAPLKYPPLALQSEIEGDVEYSVANGEAKLYRGHPLLVQAAQAHLSSNKSSLTDKSTLIFHFRLYGCRVWMPRNEIRKSTNYTDLWINSLRSGCGETIPGERRKRIR